MEQEIEKWLVAARLEIKQREQEISDTEMFGRKVPMLVPNEALQYSLSRADRHKVRELKGENETLKNLCIKHVEECSKHLSPEQKEAQKDDAMKVLDGSMDKDLTFSDISFVHVEALKKELAYVKQISPSKFLSEWERGKPMLDLDRTNEVSRAQNREKRNDGREKK